MNRLLCHLIALSTLIVYPLVSQAIPLAERQPASSGAPLSILSSEPDGVFIPTFGDFKNRFIFTFSSDTLTVIDTESWAEYAATQPDAFSDTIVDVALLGDGTTLVIALENGNLARISLDDETTWANTETTTTTTDESDNDTAADETEVTDSRETDVSSDMTSAGISAIAVNVDSTAETVYMINESGKYYYEYNFATNGLVEVSFSSTDTSSDSEDEEASTTEYTPLDIAYSVAGSDAVLITTSGNDLLVMAPGSGSYSVVTVSARDSSESDPTFGELALSSDGAYAFLLDTGNDYVWVYDISAGAIADQIDGNTSGDPITFDASDENASLSGLCIYHDKTDDEDFVYVAGSLGVSIIDASSPGSKADNKLVDVDESTDSVYDPISLTGTPSRTACASEDDAYVYAINSDGSVSVITDNPFVTISASTSSTLTESASTFALTFQSDEAGTYVVKSNSDPTTVSGTELISSATVDTADTDVTTSTIDMNGFERSAFTEGTNKIFVFVTDAAGNTGRDAYLLTVDRPPGTITIDAVNFGSRKVYITFTQSEDSDIDHYTMYAQPAEDQTSPSCPGNITFDAASTVTDTIAATACETDPCEGIVDGLENDISYCVAIRATDQSSQDGDLTAYTSAVETEATVGPAEFLNESGCALHPPGIYNPLVRPGKSNWLPRPPLWLAALVLGALIWWGLRKGNGDKKIWLIVFILFSGHLLFSKPVFALEQSLNPEHFTLELRSGLWIPTRAQVKQFFSPCCNPVGEIEFGYIWQNRYNVILAVGGTYLTGKSIGLTSGRSSGDKFSLIMIPVRADFAYRFDYSPDQLFVPYLRAGLDSVYFRESSTGSDGTVQGDKIGLHAAGGLAILLDKVDESTSLETSGSGINDVYLTFEGRFAYISSFSATGLDLTGFYPYAGLMFQF